MCFNPNFCRGKTWGIILEPNSGGISGRGGWHTWAAVTGHAGESQNHLKISSDRSLYCCVGMWILTLPLSRFVKNRPSTEIYFIVEVSTLTRSRRHLARILSWVFIHATFHFSRRLESPDIRRLPCLIPSKFRTRREMQLVEVSNLTEAHSLFLHSLWAVVRWVCLHSADVDKLHLDFNRMIMCLPFFTSQLLSTTVCRFGIT